MSKGASMQNLDDFLTNQYHEHNRVMLQMLNIILIFKGFLLNK